jgi:hypothetical protein
LVGEIHLDGFDVSHTKDDILWLGNEEVQLEDQLADHCADYRNFARDYRKGTADERRPSEEDTELAIVELKRELTSPQMVDQIRFETVPDKDAVDQSFQHYLTSTVLAMRDATLSATVAGLQVRVYVVHDVSTNDPYVAIDSAREKEVLVLVNAEHPHFGGLKGPEGVLNHLRQCVYDGIAEWQANAMACRLDPNTIKLLKDRLLRVPFEIAEHTGDEDGNSAPVSPSA